MKLGRAAATRINFFIVLILWLSYLSERFPPPSHPALQAFFEALRAQRKSFLLVPRTPRDKQKSDLLCDLPACRQVRLCGEYEQFHALPNKSIL
jgi:hypothetical protein